MSVFGFSTEASSGSGDFLPVVKYDSRSGRAFRIDRYNDGSGWVKNEVDITRSLKAVFDLENIETGWIDFPAGSAPVMSLVQIGQPLPPKPTPDARNGIRAMLKLSKDCAGEYGAVREIAGNAKVFLKGMESLYVDYQAQKAANPGKLPIVVLKDTVPVKSGSGDKQSTNYAPVFEITGWAPRGDLVFVPKNATGGTSVPSIQNTPAPSTGSTVVPPPAAPAPAPAGDDDADFG